MKQASDIVFQVLQSVLVVLIAPLVLAVSFLVLLFLLRSLVAPVLLVGIRVVSQFLVEGLAKRIQRGKGVSDV